LAADKVDEKIDSILADADVAGGGFIAVKDARSHWQTLEFSYFDIVALDYERGSKLLEQQVYPEFLE
jgi:hypothetical protein